ncbi:oligosaccharide flippase family protein [Chryseobacterium sp. CFBP8996]|uniref:oligosaccharide flippase family protein n=1 Tax=Chryseobacterium sp. CFBP8996 TaxID=3096529 RepID=UPI002A6B1C51|nr:oligosaccharide flippase family protein [Chryseobacterium sp. CFBP8996]MDY0933034.1 oligosaccharide flippase family protein [Chryseobacterium sp. CFBP8996]
MSEEKSSYRQIFKATSIFGGVQVFNILISIIRSKVIAVLLGPMGMGIAGLLTSTIAIISSLTSFGLGVSSVKDIAAANESKNNIKLLKTSAILNKLVLYTGILGTIITLVLSPILSKITFDNYQYTWLFIFLSITLFFGQLTLGKDAVLQGTRQLKRLAYANMLSSFISLIITLPLYFFYGIEGIVPSMIIISCTTLVVTQFFYRKLKLSLPSISNKETWMKGKSMLKMGFFLSLSGLIITICAYLVRIFITHVGSLNDVGFYNAGFAIINSYVGIVFTAMATDYYPRLAGVINDKIKYIEVVNQQGNVALLILGPIVTVFIVFINVTVIILYSEEFLPISTMMKYSAIGIFFKAASWLLGFIVLAKGSTKLFFFGELIANLYMTLLNCVGFYYWGLDGLGYSFIIGYFIYLFQMIIVSRKAYGFYFESSFLNIFIIQIFIASIALFSTTFTNNIVLSYTLGITMIISTIAFSLFRINTILNLKEFFFKFIKR